MIVSVMVIGPRCTEIGHQKSLFFSNSTPSFTTVPSSWNPTLAPNPVLNGQIIVGTSSATRDELLGYGSSAAPLETVFDEDGSGKPYTIVAFNTVSNVGFNARYVFSPTNASRELRQIHNRPVTFQTLPLTLTHRQALVYLNLDISRGFIYAMRFRLPPVPFSVSLQAASVLFEIVHDQPRTAGLPVLEALVTVYVEYQDPAPNGGRRLYIDYAGQRYYLGAPNGRKESKWLEHPQHVRCLPSNSPLAATQCRSGHYPIHGPHRLSAAARP